MDRLTAIMSETNTIIDDHFELASGQHSSRYVAKFNLLRWPDKITEITRPLAHAVSTYHAEAVVGPTMGGSAFAYELARLLRVQWAFAEPMPDRRKKGRYIKERYGQAAIPQGAGVLIADDVLTTGQTLRDTIKAVRDAGGVPIAAVLLVDRSNGSVDLDIPIVAAATMDLPTYPADECPLCDMGIEVVKRTA